MKPMIRSFQEVPINVSLPALEREVLQRWGRERTFEQSVKARQGGREYVFYDGPPFATGLPHYGHILTSYVKDVVPRYFTMRGYHVPRRWGWDCHGLPVEFEVEKALGLQSRRDILNIGIDKFNDACRTLVMRYADDWRTIVDRLGRWVDFDNDYKTMDLSYMESVVWCFKRLHELGLVYEGSKVVPYCFRCQTPLSNFEARMDDAFRPRQDRAVTVRFALTQNPRESLLAWTTTPWTLPSNVALAVGADIEYVRLADDGDAVWLAAASAKKYERELAGYVETKRLPGTALAGWSYRPLMPYFASTPNAFVVLTAEFVGVEEGTGVVHLAPAFGEDDQTICDRANIKGPNPVTDEGKFDSQVPDFVGRPVFEANEDIIRSLKRQGAMFHQETYDHSYPHCWRCDTPLIYRAIKMWFIEVTAIKSRLLAANQKIRWTPEHIRDGRFGNWLENVRDWAVSRNRFWGAPIPVWRCDKCEHIVVIGSREELESKSGRPVTDFHRPAIDEHRFPCSQCGGTMARVPEVLDCWFESGGMPYAQVHYPFERQAEFVKSFPGDFIVEYVAQTRGWFYTMVVLSTALFDSPPFRDAVCHGVILAEDGRKMSKRLKNYPDPLALVEEHGSDALRIALLSSPVVAGSDVRFSADTVRDAARRFCIPLWNCLHYFTAYASIDQFAPRGVFPAPSRLDRYLLSEVEVLREALELRMECYDFQAAYALLEDYIVLLSTWYIRLTKPRLWRSEFDDDKRTAYETLYAAMLTFCRLSAPFMPFLSESVHAALGQTESVHLADWPGARPEWRADEIAAEMRTLRSIVRLARSVREKNGIKHRHPLRKIAIAGVPESVITANIDLLRSELNVKEVSFLADPLAHVEREVKLNYPRLGKRLRDQVKQLAAAISARQYEISPAGKLQVGEIVLEPEDFEFRCLAKESGTGVAAEGNLVVLVDLTSDPGLVMEGNIRDLNRELQDLRKTAGLAYSDRVMVSVVGPAEIREALAEHGSWLAEQVLAERIETEPMGGDHISLAEVEIGDHHVSIALRPANSEMKK